MSAVHENDANCITERETPYGYWWRYQHALGEPEETLTTVIMIAGEVASTEARKSGKTFLVASTPLPAAAVFVFAHDHPDAWRPGMNIMFEFLPNGERIRRPGIRTAAKH